METSLIIAIAIAAIGILTAIGGTAFTIGFNWAKVSSLEKETSRINALIILHDTRLIEVEKRSELILQSIQEIEKDIKQIKEKSIRRGLE